MATEFKLPELGENMESGDIVAVLVAVGDTVAVDQPVLELETDKATIEVPSTVSGVVKEIFVKEGGQAQVGQVIFTVDADGKTPAPKPEPEAKAEPEPEPEPKPKPEPEPKPEPTPEKPQPEPAPPPPETPAAKPAPAAPAAKQPGRPAPAAPSVRRLARELGVDINVVPGSGPGGRISQDDVKNHVKKLNTERPAVSTAAPTAEATPLPDFSKYGQVEREAMSNVRRATARHMARAWATIPHVTNFDRADVTELEKLRKRYAKQAEAAGGKLTVTAIILKIVAAALKQFPKFNASLDLAGQEIIYKKYYHIGVAVDTDRGLLVPVIRDVDRKNIIELAAELNQIAEKARNRKIGLEDLEGGSFTVTNLGGIGGTNFTPIINPPEVAILGIARGATEPVFIEGEFVPRLILPLSLSYDHRLIDGADAARFLRWLVEALENPFFVLLEG
ncbi:MAG: 2-oxo acid dehydrogenase subunit E2 [Anaerolineae bacterium]|nr:2-oxo acid dehydrogenase subunit E2 [Anaerolineae bacterium]